MSKTYKITNIESENKIKKGRIGSECIIVNLKKGECMALSYTKRDNGAYEGILRTSIVENVVNRDDSLEVKTMNSTYYLKEVIL